VKIAEDSIFSRVSSENRENEGRIQQEVRKITTTTWEGKRVTVLRGFTPAGMRGYLVRAAKKNITGRLPSF